MKHNVYIKFYIYIVLIVYIHLFSLYKRSVNNLNKMGVGLCKYSSHEERKYDIELDSVLLKSIFMNQ